MLNSGKKIRALRDKKNILTLVLSEKKILNETKTITPLQVKWSIPKDISLHGLSKIFKPRIYSFSLVVLPSYCKNM
jgi:hypothetical protein